MFDNFNDGYCPQCALENREVEMLLNRGDYWECPECHLQGRGGGSLMVLRERGRGDFKSYRLGATEHIVAVLILKQSAGDPYESDGAFRDEAEFRAYLANEVK